MRHTYRESCALMPTCVKFERSAIRTRPGWKAIGARVERVVGYQVRRQLVSRA